MTDKIEWCIPPELEAPPARSVKIAGSVIGIILLICTLFTLPITVISVMGISMVKNDYALWKRGVTIDAVVTGKYTNRYKANLNGNFYYEFNPPERSGSPYPTIRTESPVSDDDYYAYGPGDHVLVTYDHLHPWISELKRSVPITKDSILHTVISIILLLLFFILGMAFVIGRILLRYRREKRLLEKGVAAPANVLEVRSGSRFKTVIYSFTDLGGRQVTGKQKISARLQPNLEHFLSNLTVLFNPKNPSVNQIYPFIFAEIRRE